MYLDGKAIAKKNEEYYKNFLQEKKLSPKLVIISCNPDDASKVYLRNKTRAAKRIGIECEIITFEETVTAKELLAKIETLNRDKSVHGIIVQLPLPKHIDVKWVQEHIFPSKDVDGFSLNSKFSPCTPLGCLTLLDAYDLSVSGKHCTVIGRSNIVGKPLAKMLLDRNATVSVCHSHTTPEQLAEICKTSDFIFCAAGVPNLIKAEYLKEGCVLVDISINRDEEGNLCGDAEKECENVCSWISPVPGGVGPMTVNSLMRNVITSCC